LNWIVFSSILNKKINLFNDVYFNPIYTRFLANYLMILAKKNISGIFRINSNSFLKVYQLNKILVFSPFD